MINQLLKLAKTHKNLVVLSSSTTDGLEEFVKYFPEKCFDFGLCEQNMVSVAAGMALAGKLPIVFGNGNFLMERSFEQIKNDICLPNLNVKIVGVGGGDFDLKLAEILPEMKVYTQTSDFEQMVLEFGPNYFAFKS